MRVAAPERSGKACSTCPVPFLLATHTEVFQGRFQQPALGCKRSDVTASFALRADSRRKGFTGGKTEAGGFISTSEVQSLTHRGNEGIMGSCGGEGRDWPTSDL